MNIKEIQFPKRIEALPRVAAYARVSSGKDAMLQSLSSQVSYYSSLIQSHPGWLYAGVYADEARTGTKEARPEFQRLMSLACGWQPRTWGKYIVTGEPDG